MNYKMIAMKYSMPMLLAGVLSTGMSLAHAESCTINPGDSRTGAGQVNQFGDLKILTEVADNRGFTPAVRLKMKAPGLDHIFYKDGPQNTAIINEGTSVTFNACGKDVTVAYRNEYVPNGNGSYWYHIYVTIF